MYVDVNACRNGRVKVDVTLAKRNRCAAPAVVAIPVRISTQEPVPVQPEPPARIKVQLNTSAVQEPPYRRITAVAVPRQPEFEDDYPALTDEELEELLSMFESDPEGLTLPESELELQLLDVAEDEPEDEQEEIDEEFDEMIESIDEVLDDVDESSAQEADLWTAAALFDDDDESAADEVEDTERMASESITVIDEMLAEAGDEPTEVFDDVVADALDELDDMSRRADVMIERLDGQLADAIEEITDSTEEDSMILSSIIDRELETLNSVLIQRDEEPQETDSEPRTEGGSVIRFFDRDASGEWVEDSHDSAATGQKVICYDGESGRLSRICGIIRNDGDRAAADDEDTEE